MAQDLAAHSAASAVTGVVPEASARASLGGETRSDQGAPSDGYMQRYAPVGNLFELGAYAGMLFISDENSFRGPAGTSNGATTLRPYAEFKKPAPEFGARVGYFPLSFLGAELEGMIAPAQTESGESSTVLAGRAHLVVQSPFWSVVPFVFGGAGYWAVLAETAGDDSDPGFHFGGGVKVAANDLWSLRVDVRDTITSSRAVGNYPNNMEVTAGAGLVLGRPAPPPVDGDGDGFLGGADLCPSEPGIAPSGCPLRDEDGDQILDANDQCLGVPGLAPTGCPALDMDADGVLDELDLCVNQPGLAPSGCPDGDADGVFDRDDQCPAQAGIAPLGCPGDTDQDGLTDDKDKCPQVAEVRNGFEDDDGCPDEIPEAVKKFTGVIAGIEFELSKANIRPSSHEVLDRAAKILSEYPSLRVEIVGHTDDTGARARNLKLSLARAEAVQAYLSSQGIAADRIVARGAGPDEPLDPAKNKKARQKNRRIDFHLITAQP